MLEQINKHIVGNKAGFLTAAKKITNQPRGNATIGYGTGLPSEIAILTHF